MLYYQLLNLKDEYSNMDKSVLNNLNNILSKSKIFFYKKNIKKVNLKNKKNNFNIILNKISDSNYNKILENEVKNKNINTSNYKKITCLLIEKLQNEGKFVECYANFLIDLDRVISKNCTSILNSNIANKFDVIRKSNNEFIKENYYLFIKFMIDKGYFYKSLINKIMEDFVSDNKIYDSYIWLKLNPNLIKKYVEYINNTIKYLTQTNDIRLITLFENINKKKYQKKKLIQKKKSNNDKIIIKCQNIIKEYIILEDIEEIKYFIEEENKIVILKLLEDAIIKELFINEDNDFEKLVALIKKKIFNLKNIKNKINQLNDDDIFIDFNKRKKIVISL